MHFILILSCGFFSLICWNLDEFYENRTIFHSYPIYKNAINLLATEKKKRSHRTEANPFNSYKKNWLLLSSNFWLLLLFVLAARNTISFITDPLKAIASITAVHMAIYRDGFLTLIGNRSNWPTSSIRPLFNQPNHFLMFQNMQLDNMKMFHFL